TTRVGAVLPLRGTKSRYRNDSFNRTTRGFVAPPLRAPPYASVPEPRRRASGRNTTTHDRRPRGGVIGPVIFDPYSPDTRRNPYPAYEWLLENEPVQRGAHDLCYVARYSDVRTVMSDRRFGRSEFRRAKLKTQGAGPLSDITDATLFYIDPPDHERLHQLIRGAFSRG